MFTSYKIEKKSVIKKAMEEAEEAVVVKLLGKYNVKYNLSEVEALVTDNHIGDNIRQAAYAYLIAHAPLAVLQKLAPLITFDYKDMTGLSLAHIAVMNKRKDILPWLLQHSPRLRNVKNNDGQGLVLTAIAMGHGDILDQLVQSPAQGGHGLPLNDKDFYGNDAVLTAAAKGRIRLLRKLTAKNGYNLSLKSKDNLGNNAILVSIANGKLGTFLMLVKSKVKNGFALSLKKAKNHLGSNAVLTAIANDEPGILKHLIASKKDGGKGMSLQVKNKNKLGPIEIALKYNAAHSLAFLLTQYSSEMDTDKLMQEAISQDSHDCCAALFAYKFDKLAAASGFSAAISWAEVAIDKYKLQHNHKISLYLFEKCKKIYDTNIEKPDQQSLVEKTLNILEIITPGEGRIRFALTCMEKGDYLQAFKWFQSIYYDGACDTKLINLAGIEAANLIFNGYVIVKDDIIDESASIVQAGLDSDARNKQGVDPAVLRERIENAYPYVKFDDSEDAIRLKNRFQEMQSGNFSITSSIESSSPQKKRN